MTGRNIAPGDIIVGLPSSGLHTNGYSLVRQVFDIDKHPSVLTKHYPELKHALGEELLVPHRCYYPQLKPHLRQIKGLAHITGGGFIGNIPRILPQGLAARINKKSWTIPPIFKLIQRKGNIADTEMYRVFNMGIGMAIVCAPESAEKIAGEPGQAVIMGKITKSLRSKIIFS